MARGLRASVIRVGNLMSREPRRLQMNYSTNGFMKRLQPTASSVASRSSGMDLVAELSPIDCTARAVVTLAGTPG